MGNAFNPGSDKYRRGVIVASAFSCSLVAVNMLLVDYGKQDHAFSAIQRYIFAKGDKFFEVKEEELQTKNDKNIKNKIKSEEDIKKS
jgi:hypothetical protein